MFQQRTAPDLAELLEGLDPAADLVHRHLWLIALMDWIRGDQASAASAAARVDMLLDLLDARPATRERLQQWWAAFIASVDGATLLADYGFASRNAFVSELVERLHRKLLPASPDTPDACELFALLMPSPLDARWLQDLDPETVDRLAKLLTVPVAASATASASLQAIAPAVAQDAAQLQQPLTHWQTVLLEAITISTSQIRAAGLSPEIRLRLSPAARTESPFHQLASSFEALCATWMQKRWVDEEVLTAASAFRLQLAACSHAAASVYPHLDEHGISMDLVFRLRQLRERVLRIHTLVDCLLSDTAPSKTALLFSHLASVGQEQRSIGALVSANSSLLAAKVAERSSETGEHYITRNRAEYMGMLGNAAGGGALTAVTTALKFGVMALGLSAFWYGFWSGLVYAVSFVVIQLLHFTLATKQPAMTAPAMAAKLKDMHAPHAMDDFVQEVSHLVRSQVAAVIGNVAVVFPAVLMISWGMQWWQGQPLISDVQAQYVLHSLTLLGPSALFAAFTGVLLFASSIIAGWVENWFVLHRLDSAMRYNPKITRFLGAARADRWAQFMRTHISGFASNISLGFMLGLVPAILAFLGPALDARHVTLSTGQLAAACASLGWDVVRSPALWWAVAAIPVIGILNLGVSFYLAFRVALQAHNVGSTERGHIYSAIWARLREAPLSFFWPAKDAA